MKKILVLSALIIGVVSCKKEVEGCNVPGAKNFEQEVTVNDGSCMFEAQISTDISNSVRSNLTNAGINFIEVYVAGSYAGLINVQNYENLYGGNCLQPQNAVKTVSWVGNSTKSFFIDYKNQSTGLSIYTTEHLVAYANSCSPVDLEY